MKYVVLLLGVLFIRGGSLVYAQVDLTDFQPNQEEFYGQDFSLDAGGEAGAGDIIQLEFGSVLAEFLQFDVDDNRFEFSNNLEIQGELQTTGDTLLIDSDDSGGDVVIQFGQSLAEQLLWDDTNDYFFFTDALVVDGNVNLQGTTLRLDADETGDPDQDLEIVAEQGTENNGVLRYDDGNNRWELSNDGGSFLPIAVGSSATDLPVVQIRETTSFAVSSAGFADVTFNTTDIENDPAVLEHDNTNTDRILVKEDGLYLVSYGVTFLDQGGSGSYPLFGGQFRVNDSTIVVGSVAATGLIDFNATVNMYNSLSKSAVVSLVDGDFLTFQLQADVAGFSTLQNASVIVMKLEGIEGPEGPAGPGNTLDQSYDQGGAGAGRVLTIDSGAVDFEGVGQLLELGDASAADSFITFDDGTDRNFGWDDSLTSFSTFDQQLSLRVQQGAAPPETCSPSIAGKMWFDTDTGLTYSCDTSNGRNKWLSIAEFHITGGESASCAAGASTGDGCTIDIHNGTDANDLGWQIVRDATIVAGSFHSDVSCTNGTGVDLEVREGDNGTLNLLGDVLTACTDPNGCSATGIDIDVNADQIIRAVLDNNCSSGSVTDWSSMFVVRWRHN